MKQTLMFVGLVALTAMLFLTSSSSPQAVARGGDDAGHTNTARDTLKKYIERSSSCKPASVSDLIVRMPDEHLIGSLEVDPSVLVRNINTPTGTFSEADILAGEFLNWLNFEFPAMVCRNEMSFGHVLNEQIKIDTAQITFDFLKSNGEFGFAWRALLLKTSEGDWKIYDFEPPGPY